MSFASDWKYRGFRAMGTSVRLWISPDAGDAAGVALRTGESFIHDFDRRLSRFNPESELCALNSAACETVEVSSLLARLVDSSLLAARLSEGLVDPTLLPEIESAGYRDSLAGVTPPPIEDVLRTAPQAKPAGPSQAARWKDVSVDLARRTVTRPVGVMIDSGGCGKGLAADMVAQLWSSILPPSTGFIVDCGGDMRLGTLTEAATPYEIEVALDQRGSAPMRLELHGGGVATSGISKRAWLEDGTPMHHLIDPSTGRPAWTGLISVTAVGSSALMAETIAKAALLAGPIEGRKIVARNGGVLVEIGCEPELIAATKEPIAA